MDQTASQAQEPLTPTTRSSLRLREKQESKQIQLAPPSEAQAPQSTPNHQLFSRKRTLFVIILALLIDLLAFTIILPLFPRLLKYYEANEEKVISVCSGCSVCHTYVLCCSDLQYATSSSLTTDNGSFNTY